MHPNNSTSAPSSSKRSSLCDADPSPLDPPPKRQKRNSGKPQKVRALCHSNFKGPSLHASFLSAKTFIDQIPLSTSPYSHYLTDEQKKNTLLYMLEKSLIHPSRASARAVVTVAGEHDIGRKKRELLISDLQAHSCIWSCRVHSSDAQEAGQLVVYHEALAPVDCLQTLHSQEKDIRTPARRLQRQDEPFQTILIETLPPN